MDRRRRTGFRPTMDDLEERKLLSTTVPATPNLPSGVSLATNQQKLHRIERLPAFLYILDPGRPLPEDLVKQIQDGLTQVKGKLHQAPKPLLEAFEKQLRSLISEDSVRRTDAVNLNRVFGTILLKAGAPPDAAASLQTSLNALTHIDVSAGEKPTSLVANDYSLILQTALAVGRPLRTPTIPRLVPSDDSEPTGDWATVVRQPHLVGTYDAGTTVTVYDDQGQSYGTALVGPRGQYTIAIDHPLPEGLNRLHVQARDSGGAVSLLSRNFPLRILSAPTPRGPMALAKAGQS